MSATITVADMQDKLLTLDQVREALASTEPLSSVDVPLGTKQVSFAIDKGALENLSALGGTEPLNAAISVGGIESQLTKDALLEATSAVGLPEAYVKRSISELIEPQLNYWFRKGLEGPKKEMKLLKVGDRAAAFTKASVNPFSNLELLDRSLDAIEEKYGAGEVLADYKFEHSLRKTAVRLIVPEQMRQIQDTGREEDNWSAGIQIKNSLIGASQTEIDAYLFAWWCTNGAITTKAEESAVWSRRGSNGNNLEEVYEWARRSVDDVLGGLEHQLEAVQQMVHTPVTGEAADIFGAVFSQYSIPAAERLRILENFTNDPNPTTMYAVMNAITAAANTSTMDAAHVERLLRAGGQLPSSEHVRCDSCHRISI